MYIWDSHWDSLKGSSWFFDLCWNRTSHSRSPARGHKYSCLARSAGMPHKSATAYGEGSSKARIPFG